ncbi:methyltransferase domain-containing protein [Nocardiopsis sp. N85]|uniref:methyltransferase domain-containing protein n=1 Tax=Nocardiopsis sp. N85 TaxID=3029400 RepID=UPI00237F1481|nr:methyltransferase domain-containing protein [Nocardiopsis sp. N85]MDE3723474.1 methyltransferase domain-containing protein [Nocardiopsis sp. N85]
MTARERHSALIEAMIADGTLVDASLIETFRAVPRHRFIPESGALTAHGTALNAASDPDLWLSAVYADNALVTRIDDPAVLTERDEPRGGEGGVPGPRGSAPSRATSSSAAPTVLARMLGLADLAHGLKVLEVGTGTGWNTALLACRLGDSAVVSVEIDERLARTARQTLHSEGYDPVVLTGDGHEGLPERAPYDRVISPCGVRRVPPAWIGQLSPGGLIVCPWGLLEGTGVLARLVCPGDGTARASFHGGVGFVPLRAPGPRLPPVRDTGQQPDEYRLTQVDPVAPLMAFPSAFALSVMVPGWRLRRRWIGTGSGVWVCDRTGDSWVRVYPYGTSWMIEQGGPRSIWDEFEEALQEWARLGSPAPDRFGLSVAADGTHRVWLDSPEQPGWRV